MANEHVERRLTAILAADVVGYSRMVGSDEEGTIARLKSLRSELFDPCIARHHGRIVNTSGDGMLVEFASVVDAVRAGIEVQRTMSVRAADMPAGHRIKLRIGINLGDILADGDNILGDGVNIAARLESLAGAGEIWVSGDVFRQVEGKLDPGFEDLGERQLKNIEKPVQVYRILLEPEMTRLVRATGRSWKSIAVAVAGIAAIVFAASLAYWRPWTPTIEPARSERMAFTLPDRPSIAVLPFTNMSGDSGQEYFSDGMTDDLITDLSKVSGLFVISRNSTFTYKGKSVKIREVAEELGVRYVLEGSIRRAGDKVRINAQLIEATTGGHIWADRYDGTLADVFALQDRVTRKIVTALSLRLTAGEERQLAARDTDSSEAYDVFLKGWHHYNERTPEGFRQAIPFFDQAIELDSNYGRAYAALASIYWEGGSQRLWYEKLGLLWGEARSRANENLRRALDHPTPLAHRVASLTYLGHGQGGQGGTILRHTIKQDFDQAISEARRAIALDPNNPEGHIAMAHALTMSGRPKQAIDYVDKAMRLNPKHSSDYLFEGAFARFGMDQFEMAASLLEQALERNPQDLFSSYLRIPTYALLGRKQEMAKAIEHFKRVSPTDIRLMYYQRFWGLFRTPGDHARMIQGLRIAGLPH